MAEAVEKLEYHREIDLTDKVREKLLNISASTIDRLLKPEKDKFKLGKGRKGIKPGTLLKAAIPIRTFADWDEAKPGFVEAYLVGHDGGNTFGDFIQSLNFIDIATLLMILLLHAGIRHRCMYLGQSKKHRIDFYLKYLELILTMALNLSMPICSGIV